MSGNFINFSKGILRNFTQLLVLLLVFVFLFAEDVYARQYMSLMINSVSTEDFPYTNKGKIIIYAVDNNGGVYEILEYSLDNENHWQSVAVFFDSPAGIYQVKFRHANEHSYLCNKPIRKIPLGYSLYWDVPIFLTCRFQVLTKNYI